MATVQAEHLAAATAPTVPVPGRDVLPRVEQAVPGVGTTLALGKALARGWRNTVGRLMPR